MKDGVDKTHYQAYYFPILTMQFGGKHAHCHLAGHRQVFAADVAQRRATPGAWNRPELTFTPAAWAIRQPLRRAATRRLRARHPEARVELYLVLPCLTAEVNRSGGVLPEAAFDSVFIAPELPGLHYKGAILHRNRWMVDRAQVLLSCDARLAALPPRCATRAAPACASSTSPGAKPPRARVEGCLFLLHLPELAHDVAGDSPARDGGLHKTPRHARAVADA